MNARFHSRFLVISLVVLSVLLPAGVSLATCFDIRRPSQIWYERARQMEARRGQSADSALFWYEQSFLLNPHNVEAALRRGNIFMIRSQWSPALDTYNRALLFNPRSRDLWAAKARVYWRRSLRGDRDTTAVCYDHALALKPNDAALWAEKGQMYLGFMAHLGRTKKEYEAALACYERATEFAPENAEFWEQKAGVFHELWKEKDAQQAYRQAMRFDSSRASHIYRMLIEYCDRVPGGKDALALFREAQATIPPVPWVWGDCATLLYNKTHRCDEALAMLDKAIALDSADYRWLNAKATLVERAGTVEDAAKAWDDAAKDPSTDLPNMAASLYTEAGLLQKAGRIAEAEPLLVRALRVDPSQDWIWRTLAKNRRQQNRSPLEQLATLDSGKAQLPKSSSRILYWSDKAQILEDMGNTREALATLDSILAESPSRIQAWQAKAWILISHKRYSEALIPVDGALRVNPHDYWSETTRAKLAKDLDSRVVSPAQK